MYKASVTHPTGFKPSFLCGTVPNPSGRYLFYLIMIAVLGVGLIGCSEPETPASGDGADLGTGDSVDSSNQASADADSRASSSDQAGGTTVPSETATVAESEAPAGPPPWREHPEPWAHDAPPTDFESLDQVRPGHDIEEWEFTYVLQIGDYASGAPSTFVGVVVDVEPIFEPMNRSDMHTGGPTTPEQCRGRLFGGLRVTFEAVETIRGEALPEQFTLTAGTPFLRNMDIENLYLDAEEYGEVEPTWWINENPAAPTLEDNGRRGFRAGQRVLGFAGQSHGEVFVSPYHIFEVLEDDSVRSIRPIPGSFQRDRHRLDAELFTVGFEEGWRTALTAPPQDHPGAEIIAWRASEYFANRAPGDGFASSQCSETGLENADEGQ